MSKRLARLVSAIDSLTVKDLESFSDSNILSLRSLRFIASSSLPAPDPKKLTKEEIAFCKDGKKIYAIKSVRDRTGMGLIDAKDLVCDYCKVNNIASPSYA